MSSEAKGSGERDCEGFRAGFIAIVGRPNVGKSTLMNRFLGQKLAITSPKPQTTRDRIRGILTEEGSQCVFVDTPGIHDARSTLHRHMVDLAVGTLGEVDLAHLVVDAPHMKAKPESVLAANKPIVEAIARAGAPAFLVLNKVDKLRDKAAILALIAALSELGESAGGAGFDEVFPISAQEGFGTAELLAATRGRLPEGPPLFPADELTDRSMRFLAAEIVREKLFLTLQQELPYHVAVVVDSWQERQGKGGDVVVIHASIHVSRKSHKGIVIGRGGQHLKNVGGRARAELAELLDRKVFLDLHVRVEENWVQRRDALVKLGYTDPDAER